MFGTNRHGSIQDRAARPHLVGAIMNFLICGGNALGVGSYAPSRLVLSLLGINARRPHLPRPGRQVRGDRRARADAGGIPGVLIAAYIVKPLTGGNDPLARSRGRAIYASVSMLPASRSPAAEPNCS